MAVEGLNGCRLKPNYEVIKTTFFAIFLKQMAVTLQLNTVLNRMNVGSNGTSVAAKISGQVNNYPILNSISNFVQHKCDNG